MKCKKNGKKRQNNKNKSMGRIIAQAMIPILFLIPFIIAILFQNIVEARNIVYKYIEDTAGIKVGQLSAGIVKMNYEMVSSGAQDLDLDALPNELGPKDAEYYPVLFRLMERNRNLKIRHIEAFSFYAFHYRSDTLIGDQGIYYKDSKAEGVFTELQKSLRNVHMDQSGGPVWNYLEYNGVNYLYSNYAKEGKMKGCVIRLDDFLSAIYVNSLGYEGIPFLVKEDGTIMTQSVFNGLYPYESLLESNHTELRSFDFPGIKNMKIHLFITRDSSALEKILKLQMTLVAAAVALVLGCMAGIFLYYRRILLPMNKFVSGLKNMGEEQWIHEFEENNILELEMASKEFRGLLRKIKNLRIEVYEKELASQRIQLEYVQEQIKPHFYLNCLNLIKTMAVSHGTEDISEMTEMLSGCMRYVIKDSSETRRLEDEIAFLYNYVRIQQLRFGREAFSFEVIMEESMKEMQIPALFLQTFVENSITHAVTLDKKIEITLYLVIEKIEGQNRLYICISDTGQGFEEETLEALLKGRPIIYENRKHIGIQNAIKRLSMIYGSIASIKLSNMTKEGGAVVEIILPVDNEKNHGSIQNL